MPILPDSIVCECSGHSRLAPLNRQADERSSILTGQLNKSRCASDSLTALPERSPPASAHLHCPDSGTLSPKSIAGITFKGSILFSNGNFASGVCNSELQGWILPSSSGSFLSVMSGLPFFPVVSIKFVTL